MKLIGTKKPCPTTNHCKVLDVKSKEINMTSCSLALSFNDVNFSPVEKDGQIWLTASELAKGLNYSDTRSVTKIFNRNTDEFTENMTQIVEIPEVVNLGTSNLIRKVRIFNSRGCHLIAMFARTDVAKQFRKWVLDVLDKVSGKPVTVTKTHKEEREPLTSAVNLLVAKTKHLNYSDAYKLVHQRFNVDHINEIPYDALPIAVEYVHHLIALYSRANKCQNAEQNTQAVLHDQNVQLLMWYVPILAKFIKNEVYPALKVIQSNYAGRLSSLASETVCHANLLNRKAIGYGITLEHVDNKQPHSIEWYLKPE